MSNSMWVDGTMHLAQNHAMPNPTTDYRLGIGLLIEFYNSRPRPAIRCGRMVDGHMSDTPTRPEFFF